MARSLGRRNRGVGLRQADLQRVADLQRAVDRNPLAADRILRLPEVDRSSCALTDNTEPSRRALFRPRLQRAPFLAEVSN